ncbi:MAG: collagenase-like protease, partial [Bacteroidales bacterium]|nr:collagenase-like protease [Bacteroidales bacterium]
HNFPVNFPMGHDRSLTFTANIMNRKAEDFYLTHGAVKTAPAFEKTAPDEAVVMTCKHCIKYTLGHCSKTKKYPQESWKEPLYLRHGHFLFRLEFDCKRCEMKVIKTQKERADY